MKRILVASDLSPNSTNALARAIRLAAADGGALRIVHAVTDPGKPDTCPASHRRIVTEAQIMAEEMTDRALDISVRVSGDEPANAILHAAEEFDADLIVLGAHGLPRFRDALFGTTGTHVVRHTRRPVLIVQNDAHEPYAKVLAAIDAIETAPAIIAMAWDIAPASELFAVHAFYPSLVQTLAGRTAINQAEAGTELALEKLLGAVKAEPGAGRISTRQHAIVEEGEALNVVMKETETLKPDLLAMGTRNQTTYLGSHAVDTLFWCPNDVLVVPDGAEVEPPLEKAAG